MKFPPLAPSFKPLLSLPNVRRFCRQIAAFRSFLRSTGLRDKPAGDMGASVLLGECVAAVVYGQLIAERAVALQLPAALVSAIFHGLVMDMSAIAISAASAAWLDTRGRRMAQRMILVPQTSAEEWEEVARQMLST